MPRTHKHYYCEKCNKTMAETEFYTSKNLEKYPNDGKPPICKKCMTMHVDNFNPDTFLWIIQEMDVPYVPEQWNNLLAVYGKDKSKLTGTTILGRYLAKMRMKQWESYRWKDNEFLQELENKRRAEIMKESGYDSSEIAKANEKAATVIPESAPVPFIPESLSETDRMAALAAYDPYHEEPLEELNLTEEDIKYLRLKWGRHYKEEEWVRLEQLYNEMTQSYDI